MNVNTLNCFEVADLIEEGGVPLEDVTALLRRAVYLLRTADDAVNIIRLNGAEICSKHSRVDSAEGLILQLPLTHEGRNTWLMNYGKRDSAQLLREQNNQRRRDEGRIELLWDKHSDSLQTVK